MAAARFTPARAVLAAAWRAPLAFARGAVVARTPCGIETTAILGLAAVAPIGRTVARLTGPALWR
ncbi:hypothetical protein [Roseomonas fluvialis]|uniref:Uncharacterized protein n=1 Tax=Roseomonas fluvialis TaxID=1750527 RepID=A0ABM7YBB2_9PROT|nr:hypothetical protein [Roseomonas fluvialis]BDG75310.1 hypothetical protein Rmf_52390 [Roseomonas fluvialis]